MTIQQFAHCSLPLNPAISGVSVKHTSFCHSSVRTCIAIGCCVTDPSSRGNNRGKQNSFVRLHLAILSNQKHGAAGRRGHVSVCVSVNPSLTIGDVCYLSPSVWHLHSRIDRKTPSSFTGSHTDSSSDTSNQSLKAYQQCH